MKERDTVFCKRCFDSYIGKTSNGLCGACRYIMKEGKLRTIYSKCRNCAIDRQETLSPYCPKCQIPISKTLYKFKEYNLYVSSYCKNILYRYKTEGDSAELRFMIVDAWVIISRYDNKWLTKSTDKQIILMLEELEQYSNNLYTMNWFAQQTRIERAKLKNKYKIYI